MFEDPDAVVEKVQPICLIHLAVVHSVMEKINIFFQSTYNNEYLSHEFVVAIVFAY